MIGRRGAHRDGRVHPIKRGNEVDPTTIWTPEDFRRTVIQLRALAAPEGDSLAPVIDIRTRERLA